MVGGLALQQLWMFWAAPLLGGLIGGFGYRVLFAAEPKRPDIQGERPPR